ncbi:PilZ domain-containing protein [Reinekea marinisedimentorum]|uniref:PilZ domain-containing protein n=1 Tax=Reinekea marinisedimentorum TaxID=230495 RepID=A0A4R3I9K2_9GAMM|nr:PilZ domain-containing protein [Reinekea marinisedimentorum]TCS43079.1 PilZ domain-containing protein [Reinekea marinisedimentorum]
MRHFIRHPTDIPINCIMRDHYYCVRNALLDVSAGGLSFVTDNYIPPGESIHVNIYVQDPNFEADCDVKWCRRVDSCYHVGVKFKDSAEAFSFRMVEQVCHIEHYKRKVESEEGRELSSEQAAEEWIARYAPKFPR